MMERIGFIGTGVMGKPMAANLLRAGHSLSILKRDTGKDLLLLELGASSQESSEEIARMSNVVILMLPDTKTVEGVLFGSRGVASGLKEGAIVIDMRTISPAETGGFSNRFAGRGGTSLV